jgi:hypothetical protein
MSTGEGGRGRGSAGGSEGARVMAGAVGTKLAKMTERERVRERERESARGGEGRC